MRKPFWNIGVAALLVAAVGLASVANVYAEQSPASDVNGPGMSGGMPHGDMMRMHGGMMDQMKQMMEGCNTMMQNHHQMGGVQQPSAPSQPE